MANLNTPQPQFDESTRRAMSNNLQRIVNTTEQRHILLGMLLLLLLLLPPMALFAEKPTLEIDYAAPEKYLVMTESLGDHKVISELAATMKGETDLATVTKVLRWMHTNLRVNEELAYTWRNVDTVLKEMTYASCADEAIVAAALLRANGIPTILVKTMDADWIQQYKNGKKFSTWSGHVFLEIYMDGQWALLNPGAEMIYEDYNPNNTLLPDWRIAYHKGLDPKAMIMSLQWEEWMAQTREHFDAFDLAQLPPMPPRGRPLPSPDRISIFASNLDLFKPITQEVGFTLRYYFNHNAERWLREGRGEAFLIALNNGQPAGGWEALQSVFPELKPDSITPPQLVITEGTRLFFVNHDTEREQVVSLLKHTTDNKTSE